MCTDEQINLELEVRGAPGYWEMLERNNQRILQHYSGLVGQTCTQQMVEYLTAKTSRPIRAFGDYFTEEIRADRLNLNLGKDDVIMGLFFG